MPEQSECQFEGRGIVVRSLLRSSVNQTCVNNGTSTRPQVQRGRRSACPGRLRCELGVCVMSKAIEPIVEGFTRVGDRQSLEDLRTHRRRLAVDLKSVKGFDGHLSVAQIDDEIEVIESGLRSLDELAATIAKDF